MKGKIFLALLILIFAFFALPKFGSSFKTSQISKIQALEAAREKFLQTYEGITAIETLREEKELYVVYYNITGAKDGMSFAEYYIDKETGVAFASARYSLELAKNSSAAVRALFARYPSAKAGAELIKVPEKKIYVWEFNIIANGVNVASLRFDAVNERIINFERKGMGFAFFT